MPDASPVKWHLAHSSWFFETFLLAPYLKDYTIFDPEFTVLFNSYYVGVGERHLRAGRGMLSQPSLDRVLDYRKYVDAAMEKLLSARPVDAEIRKLTELGLHHEQQHQELILMDILHAFSCNPVGPVYDGDFPAITKSDAPITWHECPAGLYMIGHDGDGFSFDNEHNRHRLWVEPFAIADRLVRVGEYLNFIGDGGYERPELWLSDGWAMAQSESWSAPLYWKDTPQGWMQFGLRGWQAIDLDEPVMHISHYEADAYARWADARLPTEAEWEIAASQHALHQSDDTAWQWTGSAYLPYPGFTIAKGAVGEYNGKFMANQMVLRGGSFATPSSHKRISYRNFFPPHTRWMFSGIRLARSV